jgi:formylglycine-generating enzyme required for sulfatase activity
LRTKRRWLIGLGVLLLGGITVLFWLAEDWPPPALIVEYGFPPSGGPTGARRTVEGIEFIELDPGYYRMGGWNKDDDGSFFGRVCSLVGLPWGARPRPGPSSPPHWVEIPHSFWIARTEITVEEFRRFHPGYERRQQKERPEAAAALVFFFEAEGYCAWLSERTGLAVRLPSEAEWEYACRAGSSRRFCFGDDEKRLAEYARFGESRDIGAQEPATRRPNSWGLWDMHGNVWEWCEDVYHEDYRGAPVDGTAWMTGNPDRRVVRGGCWSFPAFACASAAREYFEAMGMIEGIGFRPVFARSGKGELDETSK